MSKKNKKEKQWIEVQPYGIVGGMIPEASVMLFKRKKGVGSFVVWLSELQSRMAVDQSLQKEQPFRFVQQILKTAEIKIKNCFFLKTKEDRDIVALTFEGLKKPVRFYADEILAFCILNKCRFFCSSEIFNRSQRELPKRFRQKVLEKKPMYLN